LFEAVYPVRLAPLLSATCLLRLALELASRALALLLSSLELTGWARLRSAFLMPL
jgi:hypothetical protein